MSQPDSRLVKLLKLEPILIENLDSKEITHEIFAFIVDFTILTRRGHTTDEMRDTTSNISNRIID